MQNRRKVETSQPQQANADWCQEANLLETSLNTDRNWLKWFHRPQINGMDTQDKWLF